VLAPGGSAQATITLECVDIIQLQPSVARRCYIVITAGYFSSTPQIPPQHCRVNARVQNIGYGYYYYYYNIIIIIIIISIIILLLLSSSSIVTDLSLLILLLLNHR